MMDAFIIFMLVLILYQIAGLNDFIRDASTKVKAKITEDIPKPVDFKICGDYTFVLCNEEGYAICCGIDAAIIEDEGILMLAVHGLSFDKERDHQDLLRMYRDNNAIHFKFKHDEEEICHEKEVKLKSFSIEHPLNSLPIYEMEMSIERDLTFYEVGDGPERI